MANFTFGLDLSAVAKRCYDNILYQSTFYQFLNSMFIGDLRETGTPVIQVIKQNAMTPTAAGGSFAPVTPTEITDNQTIVNLTDLDLEYNFAIPPQLMATNIDKTVQGQIDLADSVNAKKIDTYGYSKFNTSIVGPTDGSLAYSLGQTFVWDNTAANLLTELGQLKACLYNRSITGGYKLGLAASQYEAFVVNLTGILKFETEAGVEAVDRGDLLSAYGCEFVSINENAIPTSAIGFFANEIAAVGDVFYNGFAEYNGNYPGAPGYYVFEGRMMFGAAVVRPEAIIKLVASVPTVSGGASTISGTHGTAITATAALSGGATYAAVGLPAGLSINATTGAISGTPTTAGTYTAAVYAVDANGNYSTGKTVTCTIA